MQNEMNMKNKIHKCVPRNGRINLSAQEKEQALTNKTTVYTKICLDLSFVFFCVRTFLTSPR